MQKQCKSTLLHFLMWHWIALCWIGLCRSTDHDCGPGGLWEILAAISHAGRDADSQWESQLEQVRDSYSRITHVITESFSDVCLNILC